MKRKWWTTYSLLSVAFAVLIVIEAPGMAQSRYRGITQINLTQAANAGDSSAQTELGVALLKGRWGSRQYEAANRWFQAATNSGLLDGQAWLGNSYLFGLGVPQNVSLGTQLIESAALKGSAVGIRLKGLISDRGFISVSDPRQAADYYQAAATMNDPEACDALGLAFLLGKGRPRDIDTAADYFQQGAILGDDGASMHLGQLYESGRPFHDPTNKDIVVVAPDFEKALQAYTIAANLGSRIAAFKAGTLLSNEHTGLVNKAKAAAFLEQAARHQYAPARVALAQMLSAGDGVQQNRSRALALYDRAAEQGETRAAQMATNLKSTMTQNEIQEAQAIKTAIAKRDHSYSQ